MKRALLVILLVCVAAIAVSSPLAAASDRKGFVLGLGAGRAINWHKTTFDPMDEAFLDQCQGNVSESGYVSDFKLGWAPTNHLQVYWTAKVTWLGMQDLWGDDTIVASGMGGIGATYFFEPAAPSLFTTAGVGYSNWFEPFEDNPENLPDIGWFLGIGHEFSAHWAIEFDLLWISPDEELVAVGDDVDGSYKIYAERDVTAASVVLTFTLY